MPKCPSAFLDTLAERLQCQAYDNGEIIVEHGDYGERFGIIMEGKARVWRDRRW